MARLGFGIDLCHDLVDHLLDQDDDQRDQVNDHPAEIDGRAPRLADGQQSELPAPESDQAPIDAVEPPPERDQPDADILQPQWPVFLAIFLGMILTAIPLAKPLFDEELR